MNNEQGFLQYLLAKREIDVEAVKQVLFAYPYTISDMALRAYALQYIDQNADNILRGLDGEAFVEACVKNECMEVSAAKNFVEAVPRVGLRIAEAITETGVLSRAAVVSAYRAYERTEEPFLRHAVEALASGELAQEIFVYTEYIQVFLRAMEDFLAYPAVILPHEEITSVKKSLPQMVAQMIEGAMCMETAIAAEDNVFNALARAYAREEVAENEALAMDSVQEFLNVVNGNYAVRLDQRNMEVDLSIPRFGRKMKILPSRMLEIPLATPVGKCLVILATDRFV